MFYEFLEAVCQFNHPCDTWPPCTGLRLTTNSQCRTYSPTLFIPGQACPTNQATDINGVVERLHLIGGSFTINYYYYYYYYFIVGKNI